VLGHGEVLARLERAGTYLRVFARRQDSVYVRTLLTTTKLRWKKLVKRVDDKGRTLVQAYREDKRVSSVVVVVIVVVVAALVVSVVVAVVVVLVLVVVLVPNCAGRNLSKGLTIRVEHFYRLTAKTRE